MLSPPVSLPPGVVLKNEEIPPGYLVPPPAGGMIQNNRRYPRGKKKQLTVVNVSEGVLLDA